MSHGLIYFLLSITCVDIIVSKQQGFQVFYLLLNGTAVKQNLKIKSFIGTSKNAVMTQIWIAMCVYLLLSFLKFESDLHKSLQQILRILPLNLFEKRDLIALLRGGRRSSSSELTSDVIGLKVNVAAVLCYIISKLKKSVGIQE